MRRDSRKKVKNKTISDKIIMYSSIGVIILALIVFSLLIYSKNLNKEVKDSTLSIEKIASITANEQSSESASSTIGKSIEEAGSLDKNNETSNSSSNSSSEQKNVVNTKKVNTTDAKPNTNIVNTEKVDTDNTVKETISKKELSFEKPVEGEVTKEYAKDNLIYSETLKEWVTHMGIDIKADKTTVVKSAEEGTVKTIKNDPRYGITVVIEHQDGFQTVYANLLTSEFVVEGEKVEKGQSIGTVGNTAIFEIVDEPHLHFEILKDSIQVDPSLYIK